MAGRSSMTTPAKLARMASTRGPCEGMAPTLFTACKALPPEGADLAWGGPAELLPPRSFASRNSLPPEGAGLAWGGPALRPFSAVWVVAGFQAIKAAPTRNAAIQTLLM